MRTTIDGAGRVVIPKAIRERLALRGGTEVDVEERDGRIDISRVSPEVVIVEIDGHPVLQPVGPVEAIDDEDVQRVVDELRAPREGLWDR